MAKIVSLTTTNYKRARFVEIQPDGNLVIVSGNNGEGKSSVLDSIAAALGGVNNKTTPRPIRDGEDRAEIVVETDELTITRTFTAAGSRLTVKGKDGSTFTKGQAKLDEIVGKLAMDPLEFTQLSDKAQSEALLGLVDLPFNPAELEERRAKLFARRTDLNRELKRAEAIEAETAALAPAVRPTVADSAALLAEIRQSNDAARAVEDTHAQHTRALALVSSLEAQLAAARINLEKAAAAYDQAEFVNETLRYPAEIEADLANLDAVRQQVEAFDRAQGAKGQTAFHRASAERLTADLAAIDKEKADGLAAAEFPVAGLGFDAEGVTYNGVPFKQASTAEQIRVSLAMAIALNPGLRVIRIADGSLLDPKSLALIQAQAEANDFQIWIEMVGPREDGYVIEDGALAA